MAKPRTTDIALEEGLRPRRKISANLSYSAASSNNEPPVPCHHRTTSSPTKLEELPGPSPELLAELLRGSSERVARAPAHRNVSPIVVLPLAVLPSCRLAASVAAFPLPYSLLFSL